MVGPGLYARLNANAILCRQYADRMLKEWNCGGAVRGRDLERVMGIEPTYAAWEATVLPLNYTRIT